MNKRIWELDALRGLCILGMVLVHLLYDLGQAGILSVPAPVTFVQNWGGTLFLVISGICVTLGSRHVRRGLIVLGCGMVCTGVTAAMYFLELADKGIVIYFGVLHCLGCCMLLWSVFSRLPLWLTGSAGILLTGLGILLDNVVVDFPWLMPLGLVYPGFASSDYFPLLPHLGIFLLGAFLGKVLYREKKTLLPRVDPGNPLIRFLLLCGQHSLLIYLLHQPLLTAVMGIAEFFHR